MVTTTFCHMKYPFHRLNLLPVLTTMVNKKKKKKMRGRHRISRVRIMAKRFNFGTRKRLMWHCVSVLRRSRMVILKEAKNGQWHFYIKDQTQFRCFTSPMRSNSWSFSWNIENIDGEGSRFHFFRGGGEHLGTWKTLAPQANFLLPRISVLSASLYSHECQKLDKDSSVRPAHVHSSFLAFRPFQPFR